MRHITVLVPQASDKILGEIWESDPLATNLKHLGKEIASVLIRLLFCLPGSPACSKENICTGSSVKLNQMKSSEKTGT